MRDNTIYYILKPQESTGMDLLLKAFEEKSIAGCIIGIFKLYHYARNHYTRSMTKPKGY